MTNPQKYRRPRRIAFTIVSAFLAAALPWPAQASGPAVQSIGQCPSGYFCVWSGTSYTGTIWKTSVTSSYTSIGPSTIRSLYNNRTKRTFLYELSGGGGISSCYAPGAQYSSLAGWRTSANSVYLSTTTLC